MKKIFFENLDGLRFIAFFAIFIHHGIFTDDVELQQTSFYQILESIKKPASLGVPFFFCLSGFLITYLLLSEKQYYGRIHIGKFYIRRILRIWPLYYAVVLFGFFAFPFLRSFFFNQPYAETASFWKYMLFLSNFDQLQHGLPYGVGLGVTWSLSVEEQFYLFWPLLFAVTKPRYYIFWVIFLFLLSNILMQFFGLPYAHTLGSMSDLSIGALLAIMSIKKGVWFDRISLIKQTWIIWIYILGIAHIYLWILFGIGNRVFVSLFMAYVIFDQCFSKHSLIKMGNYKIISYLGTLTYGFYLLHTICNFIISNMLKFSGIQLPSLLTIFIQFTLSLLLTLVVGYIVNRYYEKPFLRLKSRFALINTSPKIG